MPSDDSNSRPILKWDASRGDEPLRSTDELAGEEPLEIRVRGRSISITMRTPGDDDELAAGFLLTEGIIARPGDVLRITPCAKNEMGNVVDVLLAPDVYVDFGRLTRHVFASSSCGICGKASIDAIMTQQPAIDSNATIDADMLLTFPEMMRRKQATFDRTGGLHAAALFDASTGEMIVLREDVGRHNAVDKVVGHCLLNARFPLDRAALLVSGRCSFEIMQKSVAARIPIVAAVSAPSSLAVDFANRSGQALVGFLRDRRMNVYAHAERVKFSELASIGSGEISSPV